MSKRHFPTRGDRVNDNRRKSGYANGHVVRVTYDDGPDEVIVKFDDELVHYDYEEFRYTYTEAYGGCFILGSWPIIRRSNGPS